LKLLAAGSCAVVAPGVLWQAGKTAGARSNVEDLNSVLEPIRLAHNMPALAAAFSRGDELAALGAVGVRRLGASEPVQADDLFHLGSNTKSMTATLIAVLVEQEEMTWETTIADVFSEQLDQIRAEYHPVTVVQLLAHRSGVPGVETPEPYAQIQSQYRSFTGPIMQQRLALTEMVLSQPPVTPPGVSFNYSNLGYTIAGSMAEQVTGRPWEELITELLFEPLGMGSAGFGAPGTADAVDQPWGHTSSGCQPVPPGPNADNPPIVGPAGTVHSSMSDWARYAALHVQGARGQSDLLLTPESFARLHNDAYRQGYSLGWVVTQRSWARGTALTHTGSNTLWFAVIWLAPKRNAAFLAATNCGSDKGFQAIDAAVAAMIGRYL
jgi:CubicO group peptidase (beta-lactamase class C family)